MVTSFQELKKNLKKDFSGFKEIRIAVLADSASQLFVQALRGYGYEAGINFNIYEADYDQIEMQAYDPQSQLYRFAPDYVILFHSARKLLKKFYALSPGDRAVFADKHLAGVSQLTDTIIAGTNARVICLNFPLLDDAVFGNFGNKVASSWIYQLRKINFGLMEMAAAKKNLYIADADLLQAKAGSSRAFDPKMYVNADMVFALDFLPELVKAISGIILSVEGRFKKCLILDLDNTTWGGIIGDDGIENIQIGDLGIGKAFTELQMWAKQLKERGIILAVCSKNTESIAREPFEKHPDMVLRPEDIAMFVANWETKVDNIRHIQSVLNIGFDSMVFLDDNPFERNMVRENIPGITVPELPEDPAEYLPYLRSLNLFETASFSEEDMHRTRQYQEESGRAVLQKTFHSEGEFLQNLEMTATVKPFEKFTAPRVAQLSQRSNQFNLRTVRYTEEDILRIAASGDHFGITFSLRDRFGDYGLIAVIILEKKNAEELFIDTWLMSCRVLKRGMENFTLNTIAAIARKNGFKRITAEYIPTAKNGMVRDHYASLGFQEEGSGWVLDLAGFAEKTCYISEET